MGVVMKYFGEFPEPGMLSKPGQCGLQAEVIRPSFGWMDRLWSSDVTIYDWPEIPDNMVGVRIKMWGKPLPPGRLVAQMEDEGGIVREVLVPGRYDINAVVVDGITKQPVGTRTLEVMDYAEIIELYPPVQIPPGYIGIHTVLDGPQSPEPNLITVKGKVKGVQEKALEEGKYFLNPYCERVAIVSALAARYSISEGDELSMLSKDGFRIAMSGMNECRLDVENSPRTFVLLNEEKNDDMRRDAAKLDEELVHKVILPNSVSFARTIGAKNSATEISGGATRLSMQNAYETAMKENCKEQGVIVEQAGITKVTLPETIATTLQQRELAVQNRKMFDAQARQQLEEAKLATEKALSLRKSELVEQEQKNLEVTNAAELEVAEKLAQAEQEKEVAEKKVLAAKDNALGILAKAESEAKVITAKNLAESASYRTGVKAFGGDGAAYAEALLSERVSKAITSIMANSDGKSPFMRFFERGESLPVEKKPENN
jgi:hypothetical protein